MKETRKLYYDDAYSKEFDATVTDIIPQGDCTIIALNQTVFYPEGGGQGSDIGSLFLEDGTEFEVTDVHEKQGIIWHKISGTGTPALQIGVNVHGAIDWDHRFDYMQQHSGEHIVSGIICRKFNCDNIGFHLGDDVVTIDYNTRISMEEAAEVEKEANTYIWENHRCIEAWPSAEELTTINYRSKKELTGAVRIVSFPEADTCACCGTHVKTSAEVGLVKLVSAKNFHEGTRLELYCGKRAFNFLSMNFNENKAVAVLLSTKEDKTSTVVEKQLGDMAALKVSMSAIEDRYFKLWAREYEGSENVFIINDWLTADQGRELADEIANLCNGYVTVIVRVSGIPAADDGTSTFRFALIKRHGDVSEFVKEMNSALNGRGGGRDGFAQGTLQTTEEAIRTYFESVF